MTKHKKVILFLVEGFSDKTALENIIRSLVAEEKVIFAVMNGDITSNRTTKTDNVLKRVAEQAKECLAKYKILKTDVVQIIHLVDADGVFIPDSHIKNGDTEHFRYTQDEIIAGNCAVVKERNERKATMLQKLEKTGKLFGIPYRVYFMSCNLDHVLYNIQNLDDEEKVEYADVFYERYAGKEQKFLEFINDFSIAAKGMYQDTWDFIAQDLNSLKRCSNLHLFFEGVSEISKF